MTILSTLWLSAPHPNSRDGAPGLAPAFDFPLGVITTIIRSRPSLLSLALWGGRGGKPGVLAGVARLLFKHGVSVRSVL